jgi:hypothetical protein
MRTIIKGAAAVTVLLVLAGCVSVAQRAQWQQQRDEAIAEFDRTIPTCSSQAECNAKWDAAQIWVARNLTMRIATATSVLIETYGPFSINTGGRVTKEPWGSPGTYRIGIFVYCGNAVGACAPRPVDAALDFNRHINSIIPPPASASK